MHRPVRTGLFVSAASLSLWLVSGSAAIAENNAAPAASNAKPAPAKAKPKAHAEHAGLTPHKLAAIHHRPAQRRVTASARPFAHPHRVTVARAHAPAAHEPAPISRNAPVVLASARPAPAERAEADRLAAAIDHPAPQSALAPGASEFITAFLGEAFRIAMNEAPDQRRTDLANLMTTRMDLSRILVYATHAAYQAASPEIQAQFRQSFASFLAEAYTPRMKLAAELQFSAGPPHRNQDGGITVSTTFSKPGVAESTIDWQLEPAGHSYRIVDVGSDGVSLLTIQRSSFTSVMANDGGLEGLLSKMDARTRELASAAK
jgi:ABC-type transporter MlaC component